MSVEKQGLPEFVVDNFCQKFKVMGTAANGTVSLILPSDAGRPVSCSLIPKDQLDGIDAGALCAFYPVVDDADEEVREILLPAGVVRSGEISGVVAAIRLEKCVRGDQWAPELLADSRVWSALGRLCSGALQAAKAGLNQKEFSRSALYAEASGAAVYLDMTEAAAAAVQGNAGEIQETQNAMAQFLYDLLNGRRTESGVTEEDVNTLPEIYPHSERIREMFAGALVKKGPVDLNEWRKLMDDCAAEMKKRLGEPQQADEEPDMEISSEDAEGLILSDMGRGWQVTEDEDGDMLASRLHPVYRLPEDDWQLYDAAFEEISPASRRSFRLLALPVDGFRKGKSGYIVYEDAAIGAGSAWNAADDSESGLKDALLLTALLLEELQRAEELGIVIRRLDRRQLIDQPEARVILCGENLRIDPDGGQDMTAADVAEMLLGQLDAHPLMAPELKRLLAVNRKAPLDGERWIRVLRNAARLEYTCPKCGKVYLQGVACPDCGGAQLPFSVKTDAAGSQVLDLPADGAPIALSALHPDMGDEEIIRIGVDPKTGFFRVTNMGRAAWKYARGGKTMELQPGQSTFLTAGMKIALVVRRLQLEYKGLDA